MARASPCCCYLPLVALPELDNTTRCISWTWLLDCYVAMTLYHFDYSVELQFGTPICISYIP